MALPLLNQVPLLTVVNNCNQAQIGRSKGSKGSKGQAIDVKQPHVMNTAVSG